ncbi:MAG TPA: ANTAR domain-containing protein [Propionibacteriaceae bacterium]|nr:ANTAR domain-containing protein [Propionibacteriaceae bacterium]
MPGAGKERDEMARADVPDDALAARSELFRPPTIRLLVAESDPELGQFLLEALDGEYDVRLTGDGEEALSVMREGEADLVLVEGAHPGIDGLELVRQIRRDPDLRHLPVVLLTVSAAEAAESGFEAGADDYVEEPRAVGDLRARLTSNLARARERSADASWRRAVLFALADPLVIFDGEGLVLELNQAFTRLFGYTLEDGPLRPPYPWWPTQEEDAEALQTILDLHTGALRNHEIEAEVLFYTRDRRPIWIHSAGASVDLPLIGSSAHIRILRDITRDKQAQERRAAAAAISAEFTRAEDLETLLSVAEHGFEALFDGGSTIQIDLGGRYLFSAGRDVVEADLMAEVAAGLAGAPSADSVSYRPGILLVPQTSTIGARAWVQFQRPRRISVEEMIAADLLAQAFGLAVDRVVERQRSADKQANLEVAMESHRIVGQAVGILVERHRLLPNQAFDRLKRASQNRNLKLRDVAVRIIETGTDPEEI